MELKCDCVVCELVDVLADCIVVVVVLLGGGECGTEVLVGGWVWVGDWEVGSGVVGGCWCSGQSHLVVYLETASFCPMWVRHCWCIQCSVMGGGALHLKETFFRYSQTLVQR